MRGSQEKNGVYSDAPRLRVSLTVDATGGTCCDSTHNPGAVVVVDVDVDVDCRLGNSSRQESAMKLHRRNEWCKSRSYGKVLGVSKLFSAWIQTQTTQT